MVSMEGVRALFDGLIDKFDPIPNPIDDPITSRIVFQPRWL